MTRDRWTNTTAALAVALWWLAGSGCPGEPDDDTGDDDTTAGDDDTGDDDTTAVDPEEIDPQRIFDDVATLASDAYGGRRPGTEGNELAVELVEAVFAERGLQPAGEQEYEQSFTARTWQQLGAAALSLDGAALSEGDEFAVFDLSGAGDVAGELVFAGYGMTVPPFDPDDYPQCPLAAGGYDDYADLDVAGAVVLVLRHGPADDEAIYDHCPSNEAAQGDPALWAFGYKAANAALHGAAAMVLVQNYANPAEPPPGSITAGYYLADFPSLTVDRDRVEQVVAELPGWASAIDQTLTPASGPTGVQVALTVDAAIEENVVPNVLGVIPGVDPALADEVIVVGAHLDHLGTEPGNGAIYNGADDNASGTAVMLELARVLAGAGWQPARTVLFAGWNAEEMGLIGSCHYVGAPTFAIEDMVAAISVDMVGAGDGSGLDLYGAMIPEFAWIGELMIAGAEAHGLDYDVVPGPPLNASDHACFAFAGVPAVLATTIGPHPDYHTPDDTIDGILIDDLEASARLLWAWLEPLARGEEAALLDRAPTAPPAWSGRPPDRRRAH